MARHDIDPEAAAMRRRSPPCVLIAVAYTQVATIATDDHHTLQEFRASVGARPPPRSTRTGISAGWLVAVTKRMHASTLGPIDPAGKLMADSASVSMARTGRASGVPYPPMIAAQPARGPVSRPVMTAGRAWRSSGP